MRRLMTLATSLTLALSLLAGADLVAQTRSSSNSSRNTGSTQSSRSSSQSTRSSSQSTRSSGTQSSRSSGQSTRSSSSTQSSRSSSVSQSTRSSSGTQSTRSSSVSQSTRPSSGTQSTRSSSVSQSTRSSSGTQSSRSSSVSQSTRSSSGTQSSRSSESAVRSSSSTAVTGGQVRSSNVSREGLGGGEKKEPVRESYRDDGGNYRYENDFTIDNNHNMMRVAPRHREPMPWDRPGHFWGDHPHYYGYRVNTLPPHWRRISHWGIDYYFYNGIYYRSFGGVYVVCRPPFGTPLEAAIDRAILRTIRFAYYVDTYRTYSRTFDYYNAIARQNLIIAQQNARLAAQRAAYALNSNRALTAYELAEKLGLVQSYAYASSDSGRRPGHFPARRL